ncbi:MAG: BatA and WFA domain-containing protein [Candidatus Woesearchaeota archaeon]
MAFGIGEPIGLWALMSLIPFIILYLIRPKPKKLNIPSLMFFIREKGDTKKTSFFRTIVRDWMFLVQLIALFSMASAFAMPFITYMTTTSENVVLVVDVSASSRAQDRFAREVEIAKESLGRVNSIVLASEIPVIVLRERSRSETIDFLEKLRPTDMSTNLGDAILLAGNILEGKKGKVVVISDFVNTANVDPEKARSILQTKDIIVDFVNIAKRAENIGFVNGEVTEEATSLWIRNYKENPETVTVVYGNEKQTIEIGANQIEKISFATKSGVVKVEILNKDDFSVDNVAYVSTPEQEKINVLLITNGKTNFLKYALTSSKTVNLRVAEPPIIPKDNFDVYIIYDVNYNKVLAGSFSDIAEKVRQGAGAIVVAQKDFASDEYADLLPVDVEGEMSGGNIVIDQETFFTQNTQFGNVRKAYRAKPKQDMLSIASVNNNSIIALGKLGDGRIMYFGILEEESDFKFSPSYPVFWNKVMDFIIDRPRIDDLNKRTGDILAFEEEQIIKTPIKTAKTKNIALEIQGIYEFRGRKVAANLFDIKESDLNSPIKTARSDRLLDVFQVEDKYDLSIALLWTALGFLFIELIYMKLRGEV